MPNTNLPPIPPNALENTFIWREWLDKLRGFVNNIQDSLGTLFSGPVTSVVNGVALWADTTGRVLKDAGTGTGGIKIVPSVVANYCGIYGSTVVTPSTLNFTMVFKDDGSICQLNASSTIFYKIGGTAIGTISSSGWALASNLLFSGTNRLITGDMTNATIASRLSFQTTTTNNITYPQAIPNGTSIESGWACFNSSTAADCGTAYIGITDTTAWLQSAKIGTGTVLPWSFKVGGSTAVKIDTALNLVALAGVAETGYSFPVVTNGFSVTAASTMRTLVLDPAGPLATGTVIMMAAPVDGQIFRLTSSQTITALTVSPNTGQTVLNAPTTLVVSTTAPYGYEFIYHGGYSTWYRTQ